MRDELFHVLMRRSFKRGTFKLSSGEVSDYYMDVRATANYSKGAYLIGEVIFDYIKDMQFDAIGGMESGAIPLVTATLAAAYRHKILLEGFWVRKEVKTHGTQKAIEGNLYKNSKVIILDDVITTGNSVVTAIDECYKIGAKPELVLALVDREQEKKVECQTIYKISEFLSVETE